MADRISSFKKSKLSCPVLRVSEQGYLLTKAVPEVVCGIPEVRAQSRVLRHVFYIFDCKINKRKAKVRMAFRKIGTNCDGNLAQEVDVYQAETKLTKLLSCIMGNVGCSDP